MKDPETALESRLFQYADESTLFDRPTREETRRANIRRGAIVAAVSVAVTALGYLCPPAFALLCVAAIIFA